MSTLVDSNVLIDAIDPASAWHDWSARKLRHAGNLGPIVINQVVLAETSEFFSKPAAFEPFAHQARISRESIPWEACYEAGQAHVAYRKQGGRRERTLPDFFVGAHALIRTYRLLTRDPRRYRSYFPSLDIIAPDTDP
jgi:predicted nucleic acid-binding protein